MVNRSKINDPRFWKKWKNSGAVEGLEEAFERNPEYKRFTEYITWIREGNIFLFEVAKRLAEKNGFSKEPLEKAVNARVRTEYYSLLKEIKKGWLTPYESNAREILKKFGKQYGLEQEELEKAVKTGIGISYNSVLNRIKKGKVLFWRSTAITILKHYGEQYELEPERLEEAMREGIKTKYHSMLQLIRKGEVYFWESRARKLLEEHGEQCGLNPERLEEAVKIGMEYEIASKPPETGLEIIDYFRRRSPKQNAPIISNYFEELIKTLNERDRARFEEHLLEYD